MMPMNGAQLMITLERGFMKMRKHVMWELQRIKRQRTKTHCVEKCYWGTIGGRAGRPAQTRYVERRYWGTIKRCAGRPAQRRYVESCTTIEACANQTREN